MAAKPVASPIIPEYPRNRDVESHEMCSLDFRQTAMQLGAEVPECNGRWVGMDESDMRILYALLNKPVTPDGDTPAQHSRTLRLLSAYMAAGVQWFNRQKG